MRILTLDYGNTAVKASLFDGEDIRATMVGDPENYGRILEFAAEHAPERAVFCSVRSDQEGLRDRLESDLGVEVLEVTSRSPLPFRLDYAEGCLGVDRIAAAAGALMKYGGEILVVDAGTAVTEDVITEAGFKGGNISPGLRLRFRSLHNYTGLLPLVRPEGDCPDFGYDTVTAIRSGVVGGLIAEIADSYARAGRKYKDIRLVLTGGDAGFLYPLLEEKGIRTTVDHNLVGYGLIMITSKQ